MASILLSTLAFCLICLCCAALVWLHRPGHPAAQYDYSKLMALGLPLSVSLLFLAGSSEGHGRQMTLSVTELRLPFADVQKDGTYFIAGPRREISDLVVGPYADAQQSAEVYRDAFDNLLTIKRAKGKWVLCGKWIAAKADENQPGFGVKIGKTALNGCQPVSSEDVAARIQRLDVDKKVQTRRTLTISQQSDHIRIKLPPSEALTQNVGRCDGKSDRSLRLAPAGLHSPDLGYRVPNNLVFDQLGQGGQYPLLKPAELRPIATLKQLCDAGAQALNWPASHKNASVAGPTTRLVFSTRTTSISIWIPFLLMLTTAWMWRFCYLYWREATGRVEAALVLTLQWLLALRLLIAMAGLFNNGALSQAAVLWPPAMAFVVVPMMAVALLRSGDASARKALPAIILQLPFALLLIFWGLDGRSPGGQEIGLAAVAVGLLVWRWGSQRAAPFLVSVFTAARDFGVWALSAARMRAGFAVPRLECWDAGAALVLLLIIVRFGLLALGFKERFLGIPVLKNIPISMLYIPPLIVGMALMITGYRTKPLVARAIILVSAFAVAFLGVGFFASDFGMIWIFAWPAGWMIAALAVIKPVGNKAIALLARVALFGCVLSPILLATAYFSLFVRDVPSPQTNLVNHIEAAAKVGRTEARLQRYVDPARLIDAGSSASFEMLEQAAQLEPLTGNYIGEGYLAPSGVQMPLLKYQYSDNLLAVHLLWPFGRFGLAVFLLSLLIVLMTFWRSRGSKGAGEGWRGEAARLAAMTFFWSAAYMALANLNIVPFTGRNAYLLAAQSMGDLAEGFLLLLLIVFPFVCAGSVRPDAEQEPLS